MNFIAIRIQTEAQVNRFAQIIIRSPRNMPYTDHKNVPKPENSNVIIETSFISFVFSALNICGMKPVDVKKAAMMAIILKCMTRL